MERREINKNIDLNKDPQSSSSEDSGSGIDLNEDPQSSSSEDSGSSEGSGIENTFRKGTWTAEEDKLLKAYVNTHGETNWKHLEHYQGLSRSGKSCRDRWMNKLRPGLKKGPFTEEEEKLVIKLHIEKGNKWAKMVPQLPGRTGIDIRNFWNNRGSKMELKVGQDQTMNEGGQSSHNTNSLNAHHTQESLEPDSHEAMNQGDQTMNQGDQTMNQEDQTVNQEDQSTP